jgi:hypothetical protein
VGSRFFRLPLGEIGYLRAIVDGYDGLAVVRSLDARRGEVEWIIGEGREEEAERLALRLAREIGLCEIARPPDWTDWTEAGPIERAGRAKESR